MFFTSKVLLARNTLKVGIRGIHSSSPVMKSDFWAKFEFQTAGYNKYGLLKDDINDGYDSRIKEAVRRMPDEEQTMAAYRAIRANQLLITHCLLPKEEWTKFEDNHNYLQPYLKEVYDEIKEREDWDAKY